MKTQEIHRAAARGDLVALRACLAENNTVDNIDSEGRTPLMVAVASTQAGADVVRLLIEHGADVNAPGETGISGAKPVLTTAVQKADLATIKQLVEAGADVKKLDESGYSVTLKALFRDLRDSPDEWLAIFDYLLAQGAPLDTVSKYCESLVRTSAMRGLFNLTRFFLDRGADPAPLGWTPLFHAVCFGTLDDVATQLAAGERLDRRDSWERTPFLLAAHCGRVDVAEHLLRHGSQLTETGRCETTALELAISRDDATMTRWLIDQGADIEQVDDLGRTPLIEAVQEGATACVSELLSAGANANHKDPYDNGVLHDASKPEIIEQLVAAGQDLSQVRSEVRKVLIRMPAADEELDISVDQFCRYRTRTFGRRNPERMNNPFWDSMVRTRIDAFGAASQFGDSHRQPEPVWCFTRFGQSLTRLPDGRYVEIAGEHEDYYDPDFCIYNDVVVHYGDGTFDILGYPESVFPPTDFHSATLVGEYIYLIGSLGYQNRRQPSATPVYRLHTETWAIEPMRTTGNNPGWVYGHDARIINVDEIEIRGGKICERDGPPLKNQQRYVLNLSTQTWQRIDD